MKFSKDSYYSLVSNKATNSARWVWSQVPLGRVPGPDDVFQKTLNLPQLWGYPQTTKIQNFPNF